MVKLSIMDEGVFGDLSGRLADLQHLLNPATERFAPIDITVRGLMERLSHFDPTVRVVVVGHPKSGKSTLINTMMGMSILPNNTARDISVVPFSGDLPMIRRVAGKAIASGQDGAREHLESEKEIWIEEFSDRRLHANLPLIQGEVVYASNWVVTDTASGTPAIIPKLSSVASRIHLPNVFLGDTLLYCIDSRKLGTPEEEDVFAQLFGDSEVTLTTARRLADRTTFILTFADVITDAEDQLHNIHRAEVPAIGTIPGLLEHFKALALRKLSVNLDGSSIIPFSGRNALMARQMIAQEAPSINDAYNYCELIFGSQFMQEIDSIEHDQLLRIVKRNAEDKVLVRSGANAVMDLIKLVDYNAVRHLMSSICSVGAECTEQLCRALKLAKPTIVHQVDENKQLLEVLFKELEWTVETSEKLESKTIQVHNSIVKVIDEQFDRFFEDRLLELRYVLEHRSLAWFRERQFGTVTEMSSALKKLEAFTERYLKHRGYLEQKRDEQIRQRIQGGMDESQVADSAWEFFDNNIDGLLRAMETEKQEHVVHFCSRFAHHVKDEFALFLPTLCEAIDVAKVSAKEAIRELCQTAISQTSKRMGTFFDLDAEMCLLDDVQLVEANDRRINNFLRDLPEHVSIAAVEISNQWYVPEGRQSKRSQASALALNLKNDTNEAAVNAILEGVPLELPPLEQIEGSEEATMVPELRYVLEAWRLACISVQPHQVSTYNLPTFDETIARLVESILEFVKQYVDSIEGGITEQRHLIHDSEEDQESIEQVHSRALPLMDRFDNILQKLNEMLAGTPTVERAMAVIHQEEEDAKRQQQNAQQSDSE